MKENITKFDLEDAFKALDELDIPTPERGIRANRLNLSEALNKKPQTDSLLEDYYDISNPEELNDAKEARDADIAKAKLARIEKIVDLNADSPEDLLPSYVGKVIVQCPQCLTLFYKDEADIVPSEDNETVVNVDERCQHCGNDSGYTLIGKVSTINADEAEKFGVEAEEPEVSEEEEIEVKEEETAEENKEEAPTEENEEAPAEEEEEIDLDALTKAALEGEEEEKKEESFTPVEGAEVLTESADDNVEEVEIEDAVIEEPIESDEEPVEAEEAVEDAIEEAPIEEPVFTADEAKEIATEVAEEVVEANESEEAAEEQAAEIEELVDKKVEDAVEKKSEEIADEAEEAEEETVETEEVAEEEPQEEEEKEEAEVVEEEPEVLTEDVGLDILDSPRYKTNIADSTIDAYLQEVCDRKATKVEAIEISIDDVDEASFEECLNKSLKKVYSNVDNFKLTECKFRKDTNQLIMEGIITFNSGKTRTGRYTFDKAIVKEDNKIKLVGQNNLFEGVNRCTLIGTLDTANCLTTSIITYKGHIGEDLVEGFACAHKRK